MNQHTFTSNKPYLFRAIFDWLLDNQATPYILVDATKPFVDVPLEFVKDDQIVLNVNPSAVQNWLADEKAISFSARFSGSARQIYVPMNALMAIYSQENGQGMAFPTLESEESTEAQSEELPADKLVTTDPKQKKVSHLKVIK